MATVLHVDPGKSRRGARSTLLAAHGFVVREAETVGEALGGIDALPGPETVLLAGWPAPGALALCRLLKARRADLGIVLVCAADGLRAAALDAGADACLTEPVDPDHLVAQLNALTRARETFRAGRTPETEQADARYRLLFESLFEGFAYCRMLFDDEGRPSDFVYLAVNQAFDRLTGLRDVVGRPVTEVIPGIRESNPELIAIYGRVVATGRPERFEVYVEPLRLWLAVSVYRPEAGHFVAVFDNITEQKQSEARLRAAHDLLSAILEGTQELIAALDCDFRYVACNRAYKREFHEVFGVEVDVGTSMTDALSHQTLEQQGAVAVWARALRGEDFTTQAEFGARGRDRRTYEMHFSPIRDATGRIVGATEVARDVTDRVRATEELHEALRGAEEGRRTLQALMDHIPLGITIADAPDGTIRAVSRFGRDLTGRSREEIEGIPADLHAERWEVYHPDGVTPATSDELPLTRAIMRGDAVREEEWVLRRGDGTFMPILCTAAPIRDAEGRIQGGVIGWQDITERKRVERALQESESFYRQTLESIPGMVFTTRPDGYCDYQSQQWVEYTGVPMSEHLGDGWNQLLHPDDRARAFAVWREALKGSAPYDLEYRVRRHDGAYEWFKVIGRPISDAAGKVVKWFGLAINVENLKRAEAALSDADRRKDEFIAVLSHELRNPLAPIRYALPLLQRDRLDEAGDRAVAVIDRQVAHLTRLVDDLLDVSRITGGKIDLRREHVTLAAVLSSAVEAASPAIATARHTLRMAVSDEPIWLHGDPARLAQVVTNILNNSAKYTPRGGEITLEGREDDGHAVIRVRDTGMGIPEDALSTVFEMFRQVNRPDRAQGGLGIGLALARQLVEMHGGTIAASSDGPGQGAEFVVRLPAARDPEGGAVSLAGGATQRAGRRLKVLVVDDNADLVDMLATVVERAGHDVRKALDGRSAVSAALSYRPDVVLLDIGLPVIGGLEVARELRRRPETAHARLVALTGWGQAEDRRQTAEAGFDHHMTKPTDPKALERLLVELAASAGPGTAGA
ncbi:MAG TPA: PAS domain-containing protein [Vicinamibacterales bacterium]|nr:PAS domain-containing protein [Vicinamibacterales bacterium]